MGPPDRSKVKRRVVYVIKNDVGMCKVGIALDPNVRLKELQTGSPHPLKLVYAIVHTDASGVEARAHDILSHYHVHGEWFKCDPATAELAVNAAARIVSDRAGGVGGVIRGWVLGLLALLVLWVVVAVALTKYSPSTTVPHPERRASPRE